MHNGTGRCFEGGGVGKGSRGWSGKRKGILNEEEKEEEGGGILFFGHLHLYLYCIGPQELPSWRVVSKRDKRYVEKYEEVAKLHKFYSFKRFLYIHHRILLLLVLVCLNVLYFSVVNHIYESISESERHLTTKLQSHYTQHYPLSVVGYI